MSHMITCPIPGCNRTLTRNDFMDDPVMADRVARAKEKKAAADTTEVSCNVVCVERVLRCLLVFCSSLMYRPSL